MVQKQNNPLAQLMKKQITVLLLLFVFVLGGVVFSVAQFKPTLIDNTYNEPVHVAFEQNPEQHVLFSCNWLSQCPPIPPDMCNWDQPEQALIQQGVRHV